MKRDTILEMAAQNRHRIVSAAIPTDAIDIFYDLVDVNQDGVIHRDEIFAMERRMLRREAQTEGQPIAGKEELFRALDRIKTKMMRIWDIVLE
jgi:hypothetical protein